MDRTDGLRPFAEIPGVPHHTLTGALIRSVPFFRDPIGTMRELRAQYGDLVRWDHPRESMLFAFGPENNRLIYDRTDVFHSLPLALSAKRGSPQYRLRRSIFRLNEHEHRQMRRQLLPPFQKSSVAVHHPVIANSVRQMIDSWRPGERRNLHHDLHMLVWNIVRDILYGLAEDEASEQLYRNLESWMHRRFSPWSALLPRAIPLTPGWRMNREARWLEQRFLSIMAKRRASGLQGNDALTALLRYPMMDGSPAGDQELVGHVATLFLVAYETTGNTLAWTFYLLAQHPEAQHELLDELAPFHDDSPSIHQLDLLPVLDRIVKESVRILPAVPYNRWRVARDDAIGRYFLPAQTSVFFSIYATHHMNEIYAQPERFLPDRWLTIHPAPGEYLPYGLGHRMCLGTSLAQLIVKTVLSIVVPAWRVQVVPNARIDRQQGISLGPRHGLPVRVWKQDRRLEASRVRGNILEMVEPAPPAKTTKRVAA